MKRKKRIELILSKKFSGWTIEVRDISIFHKVHNDFDGSKETHFSIILNSNNKNTEKKLIIHQKINDLLKDEFNKGLHALEIKLLN